MCKELSSAVTGVKEMFYSVNYLKETANEQMHATIFNFITSKAPIPTFVIAATQIALSVYVTYE